MKYRVSEHGVLFGRSVKHPATVLLTGLLLAAIVGGGAHAANPESDAVKPTGLRLRLRYGVDDAGSRPLPDGAARIFLHLDEPKGVWVTKDRIAVDYGIGGVLFDRATGESVQRLTFLDGWPEVRMPDFGTPADRPWQSMLMGPGIIDPMYCWPHGEGRLVTVAEVAINGGIARAVQHNRFESIVQQVDELLRSSNERNTKGITWSAVLDRFSQGCYVEIVGAQNGHARRYTTADGLASNIVSHLAVCRNTLWAVCVDIYDPAKKDWERGGLCRFNPESNRWRRVDAIDSRPVRWVTSLQAIGDELWVGFREGKGLVGDRIGNGMGIWTICYGPITQNVVLSRLSGDRWTTFARTRRAAVPFTQAIARAGRRVRDGGGNGGGNCL